ncbi:MAG: cupin domain-containing protein [Bacteroidia bacterium]|nr:cupin domain-containing protein [Bacteroidia bacterium]
MLCKPINLKEKLNLFNDHWHPRILAELNGQQVKIAKLKGEFTWHKHDNEDELFLVLSGVLIIEMRDKTVTINENEFVVIPKGIEHKPIAENEVHVLLFEPSSTINTGNIKNENTKEKLDWI